MKVLIGIPHIFNPKPESAYSSQREDKRGTKIEALKEATIGNLVNFSKKAWIHASEDNNIITKQILPKEDVELTIEIYSKKGMSLLGEIEDNPNLKRHFLNEIDPMMVPWETTREILGKYEQYDYIGYIEDDISIDDLISLKN